MVEDAIKQRILDAIQSGRQIPNPEFTELTSQLLRFQCGSNDFLDRFFSATGAASAKHWSEIAGLPTSAFKRTAVRCFPPERELTYFQTSGTTEGESGRHHFETMEFYEAAILPNFERHLLPGGERLPMLIITPPPEEARHSSLVHMMKVVSDAFSPQPAAYFLRDGKLNFDELLHTLQQYIVVGQPVFLLGTAFGFVYFLDALSERGLQLQLPPGSRIMETGGFKGRTREIAREEFYQLLSGALAVAPDHIINEYGMTELSSQFYDISLQSCSPTARKSAPPWTRVLCVDALTGKAVPDGTPGLIRISDLANVGSCCVLQTEDVGIKYGDTFEVHGRVPQATPRGCSLAAEDALATNRS